MRRGTFALIFAACAAGCAADTVAVESQAVDLWSTDGACRGVLVPDPDPPRTGRTDYAVTLTDAAGAPLEGATLTFVPFMPAHGHGTSQPTVVEEIGGGAYRATVFYNMVGRWELTVGVVAGTLSDELEFDQQVVE